MDCEADMTKEEYRTEYGRHDACICTRCGEYYSAMDLDTAIEPHGEEVAICPNCGCDDISYFNDIEDEEEEDE